MGLPVGLPNKKREVTNLDESMCSHTSRGIWWNSPVIGLSSPRAIYQFILQPYTTLGECEVAVIMFDWEGKGL